MEEKTSVPEEDKNKTAALEEAVANAVEQKEAAEQEVHSEESKAVEETPEEQLTQEEINWRAVRKKREEDRLAKEQAEKQANQKDGQIEALTQAIQNMLQAKGEPELTQKQQDKIVADLIDEDIPTGGEVKTFIQKYVPKIIKEVLEQNEQENRKRQKEREVQELPQTLKKMHSDFPDVVQKDNLDYLDYHYPEVASALANLPEGVDKWSSVYKTIKKLVPNTGRDEIRRIERNAKKPQSVTSSSAAPSQEVGYGRTLSEKQKQENYKRLIELARNA